MLVAAGTYSPSTNSEVFPIEMASGIHLIGSGEDVSIIDAQQTSRVITMEECDNNIISDLTITGGLADSYGGGMNLHTSDPILTNVTISNNTANWGGGMHLSNSNPTLTHVTISNNQALQGGGMRLVSSDPILTNVTISNNTANNGGGGMYLNFANPIMTNSIIWDNSPQSIYTSSGTPLITYSDIEGGWEGEGNIDDNPQFTDPDNGDYTLMETSPCIDTGTIIEDMEYCGDAPDMGAYEYCEEECGAELADVTGDGQINVLDLVQISYYVLELSTPAYPCAADYNQDGQVNILDLVQISNYILNP